MSTIATAPPPAKTRNPNQIKSGTALMRWRQKRGIPRKLFAQMADFSERKLATYEKAPRLPQKVLRPVTETVRLIQMLQSLAGDDDSAVRKWLEKPNPAFGHQTPLTLIVNGQTDRLWEMAYQIRQGEFA